MKNKKGGKGGKGSGKGQWDLVPIGEEFLADAEMENLISLEVLTDYQIVKKDNGLTEIVSAAEDGHGQEKGTKRKRSEAELEDEGSDDDGNDGEEVVVVKKKKEKPEKKKKKVDQVAVEQTTPKSKKKQNKVKQEEEEILAEKKQNAKKKADKTKKSKKKVEEIVDDDDEVAEESESEEDSSMQEWIKAGVSEVVFKALKDAKFYNPTSIQVLTLPAAIMGQKDIVGAAETGSGKTLAFAIPIIQGILRIKETEGKRNETLQALILTPTRELAVQIKKHFDAAAKYADVKTVVIVGGLAPQKQERLLHLKPEVVIATPGRLWELVKEGNSYLANLSKIRFLAVDETDRMVERGHFEELQSILGLINSEESSKSCRQNFVFSATLAFTHDPPKRLHMKGKKKVTPKKATSKEKLKEIMELIGARENPKIVDITSTKGTCETLQEMQINCPSNKKDYYMYYFLMKHPGRTIVFCNSINTVRRLTNLFFLLKCGQVLPLHSEMNQKQRLRNLERFAAEDKSVLIATDVAARGLDIVDIQHVVHYEIPKTAESYIHRSGRTARAFKGGLAVVLVEPSEIGKLKNIFRSLNRDPDKMLPLFNIDGPVYQKLKARVDEADKVEKFEHTVRKKLADMNWMDKARKDMDLEDSDESDGDDEDGDGEKRHRQNLLQAKKKLEGYKKVLSKLLSDNSFMKRLGIDVA